MDELNTKPIASDELARYLQSDILDQAHPLMAEAFYLAAIPYWYTSRIFAAIRNRADNRSEGLVERLNQFTFIVPVQGAAERAYRVKRKERDALNRLWIEREPAVYREAHRRALEEINARHDGRSADPLVRAQLQLYHLFFVNESAAIDQLVHLFRTYASDRRLTAIDHLLATAREAREYLRLLAMHPDTSQTSPLQAANPASTALPSATPSNSSLDHLLTLLGAYLAQMRGQWHESAELLKLLPGEEQLSPELAPYVRRAAAAMLANDRDFVGAIEHYKRAMALFAGLRWRQRVTSTIERYKGALGPLANVHHQETTARSNPTIEHAFTQVNLGDTYVNMALAARGHFEREITQPTIWWHVQNLFFFFVSLPLVVYLGLALGPRVWRRRFWPTLRHLDWIIARLFASGARCYRQADPVLEKEGTIEDGLLADEKLARVFLYMGDAAEAKARLSNILDTRATQLSPYRVATMQTGLAQALIWLGDWGDARQYLDQALPVLRQYDDQDQTIIAETLLADVLVQAGAIDQGLQLYNAVLRYWQDEKRNDIVRATEIVERLHAILRRRSLTPAQQSQVRALTATQPHRQYPVSYRSRVTVFAPRAILVLLALVLFIIPLVTIQVDTSTVVEPQLSFQVAPLLKITSASTDEYFPDPDFVPELNLDVGAVNLARTLERSQVRFAGWLSLAVFASYLVGITLLGYGAIAYASLTNVQNRVQRTVVHLDEQGLKTENLGEPLLWGEMRDFTQADVAFWSYPMLDSSAMALAAPARLAVIRRTTAWYESLRASIPAYLPARVPLRNLSYSWLRSTFGALYLVTLVAFGLFVLLAQLAPTTLSRDLPGSFYSALDLYPYLYLGLFVPPMWWFVIQPLHIRRYIAPYSTVPWWVGGAGLLLFVSITTIGFRSWLTTPDLYPALTALILVVSAAWTIARVRHPGKARKIYAWYVRMLVWLVALTVALTTGAYLWREVRAYNALVRGNEWRDQALIIEREARQADDSQTEQSNTSARLSSEANSREEQTRYRVEILLRKALESYNRAVTLALPAVAAQSGSPTPADRETALSGDTTWSVQPLRLSSLQEQHPTWHAALDSLAALQLRLGNGVEAAEAYTRLLDDPLVSTSDSYGGTVYALRGLAWLQIREYDKAAADYTTVIDVARRMEDPAVEARSRLWRAVAHHNLGRPSQVHREDLAALGMALDDYRAVYAQGPLDTEAMAQALLGEGWIRFLSARGNDDIFYSQSSTGVVSWRTTDDYSASIQLFEAARDLTASEETSPQDGSNANLAKAYHAVGYTHYTSRLYYAALTAWERAADLDPTNPSIQTSLGTLYWRLGTLGDDHSVSGTDRCMSETLSVGQKAQAERWLSKSVNSFTEAIRLARNDTHVSNRMSDIEVAFTFRTLGQVYWLLRNCPGHTHRSALREAVESYALAIEIQPNNLTYHQMYARLAYALWSKLENTPERDIWLERGLDPINRVYQAELADSYNTLRFRSAIQIGLLSSVETRIANHITLGDIDKVAVEFERIYTQAPEIAYDLLMTIEQSLSELQQQRRTQSSEELDTHYFELRAFFDDAKRRVPEWLLHEGETLMLEEHTDAGIALYKQGLALALDQQRMDIASLAELELREQLLAASTITTPMILTTSLVIQGLVYEALPELEQAVQHTRSFQEGAALARIALVFKEYMTAGRMYNEALRYLAESNVCAYHPNERAALIALWGVIPIRGLDLLHAMDVQYQAQLAQYPELEDLGSHWRCRAWFKYHVGRAAFERGGDVAAYTFLRSAWLDAKKATELGATAGSSSLTYLSEGAWGYYHMVRAENFARAGEYDQAFEDYAKAADLIQPMTPPKVDDDPWVEKLTSTFKAGLMALRLNDFERAQHAYAVGLALAGEYACEHGDTLNVTSLLMDAGTELSGLQSEFAPDHPVFTAILDLQGKLWAQLATSRCE